MRKALAQTNTFGICEIAFSGREHLVAVGAPPDPKQKGLMLYTLRYENELRDAKSAMTGVKEPTVDASELSLAKQLINGSTSKFDIGNYRDDYEAAVKKVVDAKRKGKPLPEEEPEAPRPKVVNIMDALRNSLAERKKPKRTTAKKHRGGERAREQTARHWGAWRSRAVLMRNSHFSAERATENQSIYLAAL